jgi:hypothetical protein
MLDFLSRIPWSSIIVEFVLLEVLSIGLQVRSQFSSWYEIFGHKLSSSRRFIGREAQVKLIILPASLSISDP